MDTTNADTTTTTNNNNSNIDSPPTDNNNDDASILNNDASSLQNNEELITALSKQLQYYFSSQNLAKDTYLNTIMQLNSGFVPTTILTNFANVNRIIARYSTTSNPIDIADLDVQSLLQTCAKTSDALQLVLLDQNGQVIASHTQEDFHDKIGPLTFEAIGSISMSATVTATPPPPPTARSLEKQTARVSTPPSSSYKGEEDSTSSANNHVANGNADKKSSTVILRDVPESATEEQVRDVFKTEDDKIVSPTIISVQKEVGQCWFVTIDSSTSQQDLVSILLNLRSKSICDEPIKARLKTQSTATQSSVRPFIQGSGYNPYRSSRSYHSYNNNTSSSSVNNSNQHVYAGDRINYPRKYNNSRPYPKQRSGKSEAGSSTMKGNENTKKVPEKVIPPPPPLVEEHFPGLGGSPKSTSGANDGEEENTSNERKESVVVTPTPPAPNSGYAAALLKAAPPLSDVPLQQPQQQTTTVKPKSPFRKKNDDAKSTTTASTEDSSTDDKSSLSSKADVESHIVAAPAAGSAWGGGRSFAEILKKKDATIETAE